MKLLGQFSTNVGNRYIDLLKENGIDVQAEDVPVDYVTIRGRSASRLDVKLFVSEQAYEKAVSNIKDFESQTEQRLRIESKEANKTMLRIAIGITSVILLVIIIGSKLGCWKV